jgi:hypothetical protein
VRLHNSTKTFALTYLILLLFLFNYHGLVNGVYWVLRCCVEGYSSAARGFYVEGTECPGVEEQGGFRFNGDRAVAVS